MDEARRSKVVTSARLSDGSSTWHSRAIDSTLATTSSTRWGVCADAKNTPMRLASLACCRKAWFAWDRAESACDRASKAADFQRCALEYSSFRDRLLCREAQNSRAPLVHSLLEVQRSEKARPQPQGAAAARQLLLRQARDGVLVRQDLVEDFGRLVGDVRAVSTILGPCQEHRRDFRLELRAVGLEGELLEELFKQNHGPMVIPRRRAELPYRVHGIREVVVPSNELLDRGHRVLKIRAGGEHEAPGQLHILETNPLVLRRFTGLGGVLRCVVSIADPLKKHSAKRILPWS
eukprot:scaffold13_cov241-Pinguiococcus_pyrenoidosus.AAC.41